VSDGARNLLTKAMLGTDEFGEAVHKQTPAGKWIRGPNTADLAEHAQRTGGTGVPENTHACTLVICGICVTLSRPTDNETAGNGLYSAEPAHTTSDPSVKVRNGRAALDPLVGRSVASTYGRDWGHKVRSVSGKS
jgi:hypothetical protein